MAKSKILEVGGDADYMALTFEEFSKGRKASVFIDDTDKTIKEFNQWSEEEGDEWYKDTLYIKVHEVDLSLETIRWLKGNVMDYDDMKHSNIYHENETV